MIYNNVQTLLATAIVLGVSPKTREALNAIDVKMLPDEFSRNIYSSVIALDNFNHKVDMNGVQAQSGLQFFEIADFVNTPTSTEPMREAMHIRSAYNDKQVSDSLNQMIGKINSGRVFDRNAIASELAKMSDLMTPESTDKPVWFSEYEESYMQLLESREKDPYGSILDIGLDVDVPKNALVVLGGQPGMGKTALALYIIDHVASNNIPCLMFSLEMDGIQLFERQVSSKTGITSGELKRPAQIDEYKYGLMAKALDELCKKPVAIDDNPKLTMEVFKRKARDFVNENPTTGLIAVDYVTLMKMPDAASRSLSVGEVTRQMKVLAKELKTPILLLSQLNRESAKEKREPRNSDLRDSGSIEQDADIIIFPYREEVNDPETMNKGLAKVLKTKVRDGEVGSTLLQFVKGSFKKPDYDLSWSDPVVEQPKEREKF